MKLLLCKVFAITFVVAVVYLFQAVQTYSYGPFTNIDSQCFFDSSQSISRVVGGIKVQDAEMYPFAVSLQIIHKLDGSQFEHYCGGTLIRDRVVLTAAHCLFDESRGINYRGSFEKSGELMGSEQVYAAIAPYCRHQRGIDRIEVEHFYIPDEYNGNVLNGFDIALLVLRDTDSQMSEDFQYANFEDSVNFTDSGNVTIIGWGVTGPGDAGNTYRQTILPLQQATKQVYDPFSCMEEVGELNDATQICAIYAAEDEQGLRVDSCQGDSGGPLLYKDPENPTKWIQVGITSWGEDSSCSGIQGQPGIYTRVATFVGWIEDTLGIIADEHGIDVDLPNADTGLVQPAPSPTPGLQQSPQPETEPTSTSSPTPSMPSSPLPPPAPPVPPSSAPRPERCLLEVEYGIGEAYKPAYFYDRDFDTCAQFIWSGKGGELGNNFVSEDDCMRICEVQAS
eukprot:TRINITY_DN6951_c1_g1_i4.p1 TRINITY_DN6951_c1_g1~~TRINITY_DN6951_c1_g1_i4.p1  ORF type:complete len:451 (-),score=41.90 TRINITY_DN6951_c1_g1_i4:832-2184(-)